MSTGGHPTSMYRTKIEYVSFYENTYSHVPFYSLRTHVLVMEYHIFFFFFDLIILIPCHYHVNFLPLRSFMNIQMI